jgi:hypothetical protein
MIRTAITLIFLLIWSASTAIGQVSGETDVNQAELDSLWIRASAGGIRFRDQVKPCKEALVEKGADAVAYLVSKMDTRSAREMHTLVDILGEIGEPATFAVCGQLESDDLFRVRLAARVLGRIKDSTAVECLLPHASDSLYNIRAGVASALGEIGHPSATKTLLKLAVDDDYLVRKSATVALGKMPFESTVGMLLTNLDDDYYGVRYTAATALSNYGEDAVPYLIGFTDSMLDSHSIRESDRKLYAAVLAIDALGKIGDKKSTNYLKKTIKSDLDERADYHSLIRGYAVCALGGTGNKSIVKFLEKQSRKEADFFVQSMIKAALKESSSR